MLYQSPSLSLYSCSSNPYSWTQTETIFHGIFIISHKDDTTNLTKVLIV